MLGRVSDGLAAIRRFSDEMFRERELILRSQGRVHFIPLTRRLQMSAMLVVLAVAVWGVGVTLLSTVKSGVIQVKNDEIREARVAYEDLFEEVLRYQKKVATVTNNLRASQESLLSQISELSPVDDKSGAGKRAARAKSGAKGGGKEASERVNLREHLDEIDRKVQRMTETNPRDYSSRLFKSGGTISW